MQDIQQIKKELKNCEEIDITYTLHPKCYLKYITIKDNNEYFYTGGYFFKYGFDKIILKKDKKIWSVPTVYKDKDGNILYTSRFFLKNDEIEECEKDKKEYEKIIQTQQHIIEKLTQRIKELS
tara:strand:+ start:108 stop:476 length:369 start_codon:yes stop_codon:yes gene_type:complete